MIKKQLGQSFLRVELILANCLKIEVGISTKTRRKVIVGNDWKKETGGKRKVK